MPGLWAWPRRRSWLAVLVLGTLAVVLLALVLVSAPGGQPTVRVASGATPTPPFRPQVGDTDDPGDGVNITQGAVPAFLFKSGGATLRGVVSDATTGKPVGGASVWVTVPPAPGQRTAPALRVVAGIDGTFAIAHLATDRYNLAAARYEVLSGQPVYPEQVLQGVDVPRSAPVRLALPPMPAPGVRQVPAGGARNLVLLDLSGIYAESWFDDPALQQDASNVRALAAAGAQAVATAPYGWHPADQYALLSGTYPAWRAFDPWPALVPWGTPDGLDTTFWYTSPPDSLASGQESLFDVARDAGMGTAALGGPHYLLGDVSTRGVQTAQVGLVFDSRGWLTAAKQLIAAMAANANGFVFYGELDPPFGPATAAGAAPDASGGAYAQAMRADDELVGLLRDWLAGQHLLAHTVIIVTAAEAQINLTSGDNYYGMGPSHRGSSLDVPLVLAGPGVATGVVERDSVSGFAVAATALRALCLRAPAGTRAAALTAFFDGRCT